jgi:zinc finger protein 830
MQQGGAQESGEEQELPPDNGQDDVAGPAIPEDESPSSAPQTVINEASVSIQPLQSELQRQIDEDEWAAFEREVVPLARQTTPLAYNEYYSATISAAPVSAAELAAQTNAERQQRRDAEVEDEKAEEETRLVEEFEVMEGLEERVKKLKEKREALRMDSGGTLEDGAGVVDVEGQEKPPDPEEEEDDSDEVDEWGFA